MKEKLKNREALKSFFSKGQFPTEVHFSYLIDSMVNKMDDGFSKTDEDGLKLSPTGKKDSLISFFNNPADADPSWQFNLKKDEQGNNLSLDIPGQVKGEPVNNSRLFLAGNGRIGLGTESPKTDIDMEGTVGIRSRIGTHLIGHVDGDGKWQKIFPEPLKGIHAFEIVARIDGPPQRGKYALTHAIAVSTYGKGTNGIKQTRAYFGWFWNRIEFRWVGNSNFDYNLEVRTRTNFGFKSEQDKTPCQICFHVTHLWDESMFKS